MLQKQPGHRKVVGFDRGKLRILVRCLAIECLEVIDREQDRVSGENFQKQLKSLYCTTHSFCLPRISNKVERPQALKFVLSHQRRSSPQGVPLLEPRPDPRYECPPMLSVSVTAENWPPRNSEAFEKRIQVGGRSGIVGRRHMKCWSSQYQLLAGSLRIKRSKESKRTERTVWEIRYEPIISSGVLNGL